MSEDELLGPLPGGFADHVGLEFTEQEPGYSRCRVEVEDHHMNPNGVLHGGVAYTMADTGMGGALYAALDDGEVCATIEIKISYIRPVTGGVVTCESTVRQRGRTVAYTEAEIEDGERVVATATGSFSVFED